MNLARTKLELRAAVPLGRVPVSDDEMLAVLEAVDSIPNRHLHDRALSSIALARGAGASQVDLRHVIGSDVVAIPNAGTWVSIRRPSAMRTVPVSWSYADQLRQLARKSRARSLVGPRDAASRCSAGDVCDVIAEVQGRAEKLAPGILVEVERLRRAWLLERLQDQLSVHDFLSVTGERSWTTIRELLQFCPDAKTELAIMARTTGAVSGAALFDLAAWGLG